jgi:TatA/E family protein of Tat protein translocase
MFGIGMPEMILILAVALIVIGPKKLPDLAKSLGKAMGEFKKATSDLKESMQIDTELKEVKSAFDDIGKEAIGRPSQAAAETEEKPADEAAAEESQPDTSAEPEDSMDNLKAAFGRYNEADNEPVEKPATGSAAKPETDKG